MQTRERIANLVVSQWTTVEAVINSLAQGVDVGDSRILTQLFQMQVRLVNRKPSWELRYGKLKAVAAEAV